MAKQRNRKKDDPALSGAASPVWLGRLGSGPVRWVGFALALWLMLAVLYPGPVFQGAVFGASDTANAEAFERVGNASWDEGHYPLWNPYLFCGMPTFGSTAYVRFLYPPTEVFNFLQNSLGFVPLTWLIAHLMFGGLGMIWLLGRWRLPAGALLLGAAVWLLMPKVVAWGVHGHGSKLVAAMYLPWIVGWSLRILDGAGPRAVGMTGLMLAMQFLIGHPQISYYTLLATGWLGLWRTVLPGSESGSVSGPAAVAAAVRWRRLAMVFGGIALGFLLAAIILVPQHGYSGISIRGQDTEGGGGVGLDYATGWSLAPAETGTLVLPSAAGFGKATYHGLMPFTDYPNYFGFLVFALAAAAFLDRGVRRTAAALAVMAFLALMVAFGNFGFGLYELLYNVLPFFNKFRIPSMILILMGFALAIMASRGASRLATDTTVAGRPWVGSAILGGLGLILLLGAVTGLAQGPYGSSLTSLAAKGGRQAVPVLVDAAWALHKADLLRIGLLLVAAGSVLWYASKNEVFRRRGLVWVLMLLVCVDFLSVAGRIVHPEESLQQVGRDASGRARLVPAVKLQRDYVPATDAGPGPGADKLAEFVGHGRVWALGATGEGNIWMADGIRSLGGYHPAKLATYEPIRKRLFSTRPAGRLASWLGANVMAFEAPFSEPELQTLAGLGANLDPSPLYGGGPVLYRNRAALPRARLVTAWESVEALPEKDKLEPFLDAVQEGAIDVAQLVHLDRTPDPLPQEAPGELPVPVFVRDSLDEVALRVTTPAPALLLLADMMAPGWSVEVDGEPAEILTADLVLRAVALERGDHDVVFRYRDPSVQRGLILTLVGLAILAGLFALPFVLDRRGGPRGETAVDE